MADASGFDPLNTVMMPPPGQTEQRLAAFIQINNVNGHAKNPVGSYTKDAKWTNIKYIEMITESAWDNSCASVELARFHGVRVIIDDWPAWNIAAIAAIRQDQIDNATVVFTNSGGSEPYMQIKLEKSAGEAGALVRIARSRVAMFPNGKWGVDLTLVGPKITCTYKATPCVFDFTDKAEGASKPIEAGASERVKT